MLATTGWQKARIGMRGRDAEESASITPRSAWRASSNWNGSSKVPVHLITRPGRPVAERAPKKSAPRPPQPSGVADGGDDASVFLAAGAGGEEEVQSRQAARRRRRRATNKSRPLTSCCGDQCAARSRRRRAAHASSACLTGQQSSRQQQKQSAAPVPGDPGADVPPLGEEPRAQVAPGGGLVGEEDYPSLRRGGSSRCRRRQGVVALVLSPVAAFFLSQDCSQRRWLAAAAQLHASAQLCCFGVRDEKAALRGQHTDDPRKLAWRFGPPRKTMSQRLPAERIPVVGVAPPQEQLSGAPRRRGGGGAASERRLRPGRTRRRRATSRTNRGVEERVAPRREVGQRPVADVIREDVRRAPVAQAGGEGVPVEHRLHAASNAIGRL